MSQPRSLPPTSSTTAARPTKRRMPSQELDFFTPAATSFRPRPYTPHTTPVSVSLPAPSVPVRNHSRSMDAHTLPPAGMDPQPTDPSVLFIHPPFTTFPDSHLYPDGLSYQLMAENPEWFLDADDFIAQHNLNTNAIPYPPHLEPPRGWCPAKKKDLRDRGSEGWPEGEEPRLRCTFCRRTYAGVNAKSMWRRHVFEKHKIAMSNRRDGNERPRGRGSNKENKQVASKPHHESLDNFISIDVDPQSEFRNTSHKSKFRSLLPAEEANQRSSSSKSTDDTLPPTPKIPQDGFPATLEDNKHRNHPLSKSHVPPISPPLTPQSSMSSDPANTSMESDSLAATSPPSTLPVVPPSPYDPLLTPSFRHSPPRLPSDQPWRFPSPSHPLHSRSRELSLSMLVRDRNSPAAKSSPIIGESPRLEQASPAPSPRIFGSSIGKRSILDLGTPESLEKFRRPSPRALFSKGRPPVLGGRPQYCIQESPLRRSSRAITRGHKHSNSELSDEWLSEVSLTASTSNLDTSELLTGSDPFAIMYSPWGSLTNNVHQATRERSSSPVASAGAESPVLRNSTLHTGVGLGIGLLGPFTLPDDARHAGGSDFNGMLTYASLAEEEDDEAEVACFLAVSTKDNIAAGTREKTPPLKKRRMAIENRK